MDINYIEQLTLSLEKNKIITLFHIIKKSKVLHEYKLFLKSCICDCGVIQLSTTILKCKNYEVKYFLNVL